MKKQTFIIAALLATSFSSPLHLSGAESLQGAQAVLEIIQEKTQNPDAEENADPFEIKLEHYVARRDSLPVMESAQEWLDLMRDGSKQKDVSYGQNAPLNRAFDSLPDPDVWSEILELLRALPDTGALDDQLFKSGMLLMFYTLTGDPDSRAELIEELAQLPKDNPTRYRQLSYLLTRLLQNAVRGSADPDAILRNLTKQILDAKRDNSGYLRIPNIVRDLGEEKSRELLKEILLIPGRINLNFDGRDSASATMKLAREIALEVVDEAVVPHWELTHSIDGVALYEAYKEKFSTADESAEERGGEASLDGLDGLDQNAVLQELESHLLEARRGGGSAEQLGQMYYLLGLIADQRTDDAVRVARSMKFERGYLLESAVTSMFESGYIVSLDRFLHSLLSEDPSLDLWNLYILTASHAQNTKRMAELIEKSIEAVSPAKRQVLQFRYIDALFADDQVEKGIPLLQAALNADNLSNAELYEMSLKLANLGRLLGRSDWQNQGLEKLAKVRSPESMFVLETLIDHGQFEQAENLAAERLAKSIEKNETARESWDRVDPQEVINDLVRIYGESGRLEDVLVVADSYPWWQSADLVEIQDFSTPGIYIARALLERGEKAQAARISKAILDIEAGNDEAYAILIQSLGNDAIGFLDSLFVRDQFEERPLIWKARILLENGKLEEAEATVKQAIAIDPSDGEQGKGDRMRAYAVLGDIRKASGDDKDAAFFEDVLKAIRLSEDADDYTSAGLLKRAVKMYQESLTIFADAYCIQSRLAIQLSNLGMHDQAERYYLKAYELMPDSFGRVESHCFGCEGAFRSETAQNLAEQVFTRLAVENPGKPQIHYLLGYLRNQQGRFQEAVEHYRKATALDPEYLNAWVNIHNLGSRVSLTTTEKNEIGLRILELDPMRRHSHFNIRDVADHAGLYRLIVKTRDVHPTKPKNLYAFGAVDNEVGTDTEDSGYYYYGMVPYREDQNPAKVLQQNEYIQSALQILQSGNSLF